MSPSRAAVLVRENKVHAGTADILAKLVCLGRLPDLDVILQREGTDRGVVAGSRTGVRVREPGPHPPTHIEKGNLPLAPPPT